MWGMVETLKCTILNEERPVSEEERRREARKATRRMDKSYIEIHNAVLEERQRVARLEQRLKRECEQKACKAEKQATAKAITSHRRSAASLVKGTTLINEAKMDMERSKIQDTVSDCYSNILTLQETSRRERGDPAVMIARAHENAMARQQEAMAREAVSDALREGMEDYSDEEDDSDEELNYASVLRTAELEAELKNLPHLRSYTIPGEEGGGFGGGNGGFKEPLAPTRQAVPSNVPASKPAPPKASPKSDSQPPYPDTSIPLSSEAKSRMPTGLSQTNVTTPASSSIVSTTPDPSMEDLMLRLQKLHK